MLIELNERLPEHFYRIETFLSKALEKAHKEHVYFQNSPFVLAGGAISNYFIEKEHGTPVLTKDIDIFISDISSFLVETLEHDYQLNVTIQTREEFGSYGEGFLVNEVIQFEWEGYTIELISRDLDTLFDFDLRFRMFYLAEGKLYAHQHALDDIRSKRLKLMTPVSFRSTLIRIEKFRRTLGFTLDAISEQFMKWYATVEEIPVPSVKTYVENSDRIDSISKERLLLWIEKNRDEKGKYFSFSNANFPFHPTIEEVVYGAIKTVGSKIGLCDMLIDSYVPPSIQPKVVHVPSDDVNAKLFKTYKSIAELVQCYGELRSMFVLNFDIGDLDPNHLYEHADLLIGNESVVELAERYHRKAFPPSAPFPPLSTTENGQRKPHFYDLESQYVEGFRAFPLDVEVAPVTYFNEWSKFSLADVLSHHVITFSIMGQLTLVFRRCENGGYTHVAMDWFESMPIIGKIFNKSFIQAITNAYDELTPGEPGMHVYYQHPGWKTDEFFVQYQKHEHSFEMIKENRCQTRQIKFA